MKLPEPIAKLVQEVFVKYGEEEDVRTPKEDPEAYLVALLLAIKERLPEMWATLDQTVERATYEERLEEARQYLQKQKSQARK